MMGWASLLAFGFAAAQPAAAPPARPELAVVIEVDGLSVDLFQRYRGQFSGGLGRLSRGAVFPYVATGQDSVGSLAAQVTAPGVTGAVSGSTSNPPGVLNRWTWNGRQFADNVKASTSRVLPVASQAIGALIATAEPGLVPPPACANASRSVRFARAAGDAAAFSSSPALDGAVLAVGAGMVGELRMGIDSAPDVIGLRLPALAITVESYGSGSEAACLHLLSLDRDLAGFFSQLDRGGLDYVVLLTGRGKAAAPVIFWKSGLRPIQSGDAVSPEDATTTLSAVLGLKATPSGGRCLEVVAAPYCRR